MGILALLIDLLIISIPFGVLLRLTPIPNVSLYPHDIISGLILVTIIVKTIATRNVNEKKLLVLSGGFVLIGLISLLFNAVYLNLTEFLISFAYLFRYAALLSIIFVGAYLSETYKNKVNIKLIIAGSTMMVFGFIQYLLYPNLKNLYYAGWDDHLYRLFSTFLDPNFAGAFLVLFFVLVFQNIITNFKNKFLFISYSILGVFAFVSILLTYSRSAFIMLIICLITLTIINRLYKFGLIALFLCISMFFLFSNTKIEGLNPFRIASAEARIDTAVQSLEVISKNLIVGVGFNAYRYAQLRYGLRTEHGILNSNADAGTDNSYLFVIATTGIIGFLVYIDFWINILKRVFSYLGSKSIYPKVAIASIFGLLINTIFINSMFYSLIVIWVFLIIGITVSRKQ